MVTRNASSLPTVFDPEYVAAMFGDGFEQSTILRTGPDGLTRVIVRSSWAERESVLVEAHQADLVFLRRWSDFHHEALGSDLFGTPSALNR